MRLPRALPQCGLSETVLATTRKNHDERKPLHALAAARTRHTHNQARARSRARTSEVTGGLPAVVPSIGESQPVTHAGRTLGSNRVPCSTHSAKAGAPSGRARRLRVQRGTPRGRAPREPQGGGQQHPTRCCPLSATASMAPLLQPNVRRCLASRERHATPHASAHAKLLTVAVLRSRASNACAMGCSGGSASLRRCSVSARTPPTAVSPLLARSVSRVVAAAVAP